MTSVATVFDKHLPFVIYFETLLGTDSCFVNEWRSGSSELLSVLHSGKIIRLQFHFSYEIQLTAGVRRKGLGKFLMQILELMAYK